MSQYHRSRSFPVLDMIGLSGILVTFADTLSEAANRAALAFRAQLQAESWSGIEETATALTSVFVSFDPCAVSHDALAARLQTLLASRDWFASALPRNRRRWRIPAVFGGELAPQLNEAAALAGLTPEAAIAELSTVVTRVITIGFAPGQPYLGILPEAWDIPRQSALTRQVPQGALAVAIRQMVLFTTPTPTGWRHVAQTAFRGFRPESDTPFALRPGDEVTFSAITDAEYQAILAKDHSGNGGACWDDIA